MQDAGFIDPSIAEYFDTFLGTTKERTARRYGVRGANLRAAKPA